MDLVALAAVAMFGIFVYCVYWLAKHPKPDNIINEENDHTPELVAMEGVVTNNPILSSVAYGIPQPTYTDPPASGDDLFDEAVVVATAVHLLSDDTPSPCPMGEARPTATPEAVTDVWEHHKADPVDEPIEELKTETVKTEYEIDREADKAEDAADAASDAAESSSDSSSDTGGGGGDD